MNKVDAILTNEKIEKKESSKTSGDCKTENLCQETTDLLISLKQNKITLKRCKTCKNFVTSDLKISRKPITKTF